MWPMLDSTAYPEPRKPAMVFALAGDSTITRGFGTVRHPSGSVRLARGAVRLARVPDGCLNCHAGAALWCPSVEKNLIETFGTIGLLITIFAESSLIFFLPGDT